jgi:hypothetical protein
MTERQAQRLLKAAIAEVVASGTDPVMAGHMTMRAAVDQLLWAMHCPGCAVRELGIAAQAIEDLIDAADDAADADAPDHQVGLH